MTATGGDVREPGIGELSGSDDGGIGVSGDVEGFADDAWESPFAAPFAGWVALADLVSDESDGIANLMRGGAYLARAALQEQVPSLLEALTPVLVEAGFAAFGGPDARGSARQGSDLDVDRVNCRRAELDL